jgi:acetolactate synthase-1/2/3 large subunit
MSNPGVANIPVAEAIANLLVDAGVRRAYTVPGESFLPLLEAFDRHPELQVISARHEGGAAFMAEADGKLSGVPAVVMATRGVGAANLSIGLHTARQDGTPMLALLGQVETTHLGNEAFQEVDLPKFLAEVSVWGATVHRSDRAAEAVARGLVRATTGRRGPAVVAFPADVLDGECAPQERLITEVHGGPHVDDLKLIVTMLRAANRPVVIAGAGNDHAALLELADRFGIGVYSSFRRQDQFPNDDDHYLGHLSLGTPKTALAALVDADLVMVLGDRLDETTTQGYSLPVGSTKLIHVHPDPAVLGFHQRTDLAIAADPALTCKSILSFDSVSGGDSPDGFGIKNSWWRTGHKVYLDLAAAAAAPVEGGGLHPGLAIDAVKEVAAPGTIVVNDAGNFSVYLHRQWVFSEPNTQAAPISGAMGYAVPGAVGAALARPGRPVLAVAGDGGFLMTCTELETSLRLGLNIKVLVLQNGLYGTIAMHQAASGRAVSACDISPVDIAGIARALGAHAIECFDKASLAESAREFMKYGGTAVMVVHTDPDIIAPGRSLSQMVGAKK